MNSTKRILFPIPADEQSPFVDCLLKFIDWQTLRIEHLEKEIQKLKTETGRAKLIPCDMNKKVNDDRGAGKRKKRYRDIGTLKIDTERVIEPENIRQLLVENIQQQLINMKHKNKRQFTRINIQQDVNLNFGSRRYYKHSIKNISLGGIYVKGDFHQQECDICTIHLDQSDLYIDLEIHAVCSVVKVNGDDGMALEFISMKLNDFLHLQTVLLYESDDPVILGTEFVNNLNLEFENDLILCNGCSFNRYKRITGES